MMNYDSNCLPWGLAIVFHVAVEKFARDRNTLKSVGYVIKQFHGCGVSTQYQEVINKVRKSYALRFLVTFYFLA